MLKGIMLIGWDPKRGPFVKTHYPLELPEVGDMDLIIKIYGANVIVERVEGYHKVVHTGIEVASYYSGSELNMILAAIVADEPADTYREAIMTIAPILFRRKGMVESTEEWERLFKTMQTFPQMTLDEKIAFALADKTKRDVLEYLSREIAPTLDDIRKVLTPKYPGITRAEVMSHVDLLERLGIVVKVWPPKEAEAHIMLARDIFIGRNIKGLDAVIDEKIAEALSSFLDSYDWKKDQIALANILSSAEGKKILSLLKRPGDKTTENFDEKMLEEMVKNYLVFRAGDEIILIMRPEIHKIFPRYILARLFNAVKKNEVSREFAMECLRSLKASYLR